jgi:parvulin-like peptidyl-prolyl isomerase
MGLSLAEYRQRRQRDLAIEKLIATRIARDVVISDQDIKAYYREHAARYRIPERLHIRHITLRFPLDADEARKSAVGDRLRDIQRQITAGGDFAEMASRYSEDPSRQKGGDAGFMDADVASRAFGERVLEIPTGQVSAPLETPGGYHLVTIEARRPSREIPLSAVREGIRQTLFRQKTGAPVRTHVKALREKAKIIVHQ